MIDWSSEEVSKRDTKQLKTLRENAARLHQQHVVDLCDVELERRKPAKSIKIATGNENRSGQYVSEFHFVCPGELGVSTNPDGTRWTGTWVVSEDNAKAAEKYGSVVALHASRSEHSYIQGVVKGWRKSKREPRYHGDQKVRTESGIDFLFEPLSGPLPWKGDATGEKGYAWSSIPT